MNKMAKSKTAFLKARYFIISAVLIAVLAGLYISDRFEQTDYRTYYRAGQHFIHGEYLYFNTGSIALWNYVYPPPSAIFFIIDGLLPLEPAKILHYLANCFMILVLLFRLEKHFGKISPWRCFLFFLVIGVHLHRELLVGNLNLIILILILFSFTAFESKKFWLFGFLFVPAMILKPHFAFLLFPLIIKEARILAPLLITTAIIFIAPLAFYEFGRYLELWNNWFDTIFWFNANYTGTPKFYNTLGGLLSRLPFLGNVPGIILQIPGVVVFLAVVITIHRKSNSDCLRGYIFYLAFIPLLFASDIQVFLVGAPLIYIIIKDLEFKKKRLSAILIVLTGLFLYGGNWHDLWGHKLSVFAENAGFAGLGMMVLMVYYFGRTFYGSAFSQSQ